MPLETLSGWPQVTNPTPLQVLLLLVGFPLLVFIIVVAISKIAAKESEQVEPVSDSQDAEARVQAAAETSPAEEHVEGDDTGEHVGGAGARW